MQETLNSSSRAVSLGASHGYRFEGDTAFLNADLAIEAPASLAAERWALQLWACDAPYQGGPLRGIKVAEATLDGISDRLEANTLARLPPAQRDYAMVLVLAADGQVHDFSNYPARQRFTGPHLTGSVGYRFEDEQVVLQAGVRNPRELANLSGTLALELWALPQGYDGGELAGTRLAQLELGSVSGQDERMLDVRAARTQAPEGEWRLTLVLREWTGAGYQTRDFCNFPVPYRVEPAVRVVSAPVAVNDAAPVLEQAPAKTEPVAKAEPVAKPVAKAVPAAKPAKAPAVEATKPKLALKALAQAEPPTDTDERVSISTASAEELAAVKGLNLKLAQAIVRARPFASLDDLTRVRGIGDKLLQQLRARLTR